MKDPDIAISSNTLDIASVSNNIEQIKEHIKGGDYVVIPLSIRVPASTANVGPGFDSVGIALSLYLHVVVKEKSNKWQVIHSF